MLFTARKHTDRLMDKKKNIYCLLGDCVTPLQNFTIYSILKSLLMVLVIELKNHFLQGFASICTWICPVQSR